MKPEAIDALHEEWNGRFDEALSRVIMDHRRELASAGKSVAEIEAEIAALSPQLDQYRQAQHREIRGLIVAARYGLVGAND